jgi:putative transposase
MPDDRRNRVPGGTYFFRVNLANRRSDLLVREIETLRASIRAVLLAAPFHTNAWVVLPDHMHCIWTLPEDDTDYSGRRFWRVMGGEFGKNAFGNIPFAMSGIIAHIWIIYIVVHPAAWPYSTFHKCVALGLYDAAWSKPDHTTTPSGMGQRP